MNNTTYNNSIKNWFKILQKKTSKNKAGPSKPKVALKNKAGPSKPKKKEPEMCMICYEDFKPRERPLKLQCNHKYHRRCLELLI